MDSQAHEFPDNLCCPVSFKPLADPVVLPCGHTFGRDAVQPRSPCPLCKRRFEGGFATNFALKDIVEEYARTHNLPLPAPRNAPGESRPLVSYNRELLSAARYGNIEQLKRFLELGAGVNASDNDGNTPLLNATIGGHLEVVCELLRAGADVNLGDNFGDTPLIKASFYGHLEVVHELLRAGADINATGDLDFNALHYATAFNNLALVGALCQAGATVNAPNESNGYTALHLAADNGYLEVARVLLRAGADVNAVNIDGQTADDICYYPAIKRLLIEYGYK